MIDLHSHILPRVDDGPLTLGESLGIAVAAVADGIEILAATPHVRADYPTRPEAMEAGVEQLRSALAEAGIPLELRTGGEIALPMLDQLSEDALARFGLGGSPAYVLLEFPYGGWPATLAAVVLDLRSRGITPVIAHPERNAEVQADPERLRPIVLAGALVQLTSASLDGRFGKRARTAAYVLLDRWLAHLIASDAHTPDIRSIGMRAASAAVGDVELARWLTEDVPAAIIAGEPAPTRPSAGKPRPALRLLRRLS